MKRLLYYISALLVLASCTDSIFSDQFGNRGSSSDMQICAQVHPYTEHSPDTKASNEENSISNMLMFITDNGGTIRDAQFISGSKFLFNVDRSRLNDANGLDQSSIHIVANYPSNIDVQDYIDSKSVSDIESLAFSVSEGTMIDIPSVGIPMYGKKEGVNLEPHADLSDNEKIIRIELQRLYSKVTFIIQVKPTQWFDDKIQSFVMEEWTVHNVPKYVKVKNNIDDNGTLAEYIHTATVTRRNSSRGDNTVYQSRPDNNSDVLSFSFYMPEHKTSHKQNVDYPWLEGVQESEKGAVSEQFKQYRQYLKPEWVKETSGDTEQSKYATYVEIHGKYIDHNGAETVITYYVYPGANEYDDFNILRDFEYKNNIVIKGINNSMHATGSWVTYDHRVDVEQRDVVVNMQRETLLDCHWEIRPLRITLSEDIPQYTEMTISIIDPKTGNPVGSDGLPWIRMEVPDNPAGNDYCSVSSTDDIAYGKRKYFTTDLVSTTLKTNVSKTISKVSDGEEEHTVWIYVDEYANKKDADDTFDGTHPGYRNAIVRCSYSYEDTNGTHHDVSQDFIFRQWNIFKVEYGERPYYIEQYEEYLYNFDSKDQYVDAQGRPTTTDGMPWGMYNVELSEDNRAVVVPTTGWGIISGIIDNAVSKLKLLYDFYLSRDIIGKSSLTAHDYDGLDFTRKIAERPEAKIGKRPTNEMPESAVEYCINKNRRIHDKTNSENTGTINYNENRWYLPAIDEIEDICQGGYDYYEEFQDKLYWSSQPSFKLGKLHYVARITDSKQELDFYCDDIGNEDLFTFDGVNDPYYDKYGRARTTKVNAIGQTVPSESHGYQRVIFASGSGNTLDNKIQDELVYKNHSIYLEDTYNVGVWPFASNKKYTLDVPWSTETHYYDTGNRPRDEIHRVRCVYSVD